jgi:hypothetical protein
MASKDTTTIHIESILQAVTAVRERIAVGAYGKKHVFISFHVDSPTKNRYKLVLPRGILVHIWVTDIL